jgi:phenylacetate 2-hydroxylase
LANRELYTAFLRLIVAFKIFPAESREDRPIIDPLDCSRSYTALTLDPKDFKLRLVCRDQESVERWLEGSEMRTKEL